jgi:hypothetical protein
MFERVIPGEEKAMLKNASEVIASGDLKQVVDFAIETDRTVKASLKELDAAKVYLREEATKVAAKTGDSKADLEGNLGVAQVVFPRPCPKVLKGVDLLAAEPGLPPEVFHTLFRKRVVVEFCDDFERKLASLTPAQKAVVSNLVEIAPSTPRVNLPK